MSFSSDREYEAIVLGAGHAGCEAALALARMGHKTLCLTINLESVAFMACNPAIGGTSKGHLVREIDALGGEMGLATDDTMIQVRMLNTGKGVAVQSLRAQMDKRRYHERMKSVMENTPNLRLMQGECAEIIVNNGKIAGVKCTDGTVFSCKALIVACGVYLKSRILIGEHVENIGPAGLSSASKLSASLEELGFILRRFKTGTPPRINGRSIDYSKMVVQHGDEPMHKFSFLTQSIEREQTPCYLTYTNERTYEIIKNNLHRSAMYSGLVQATGTRYCPSIEDKIVRFADKEKHQIFIEPEGLTTNEKYVQGLSTSLPGDVQIEVLHSIQGLENAEVMRYGYAIEYDCIDPTELDITLASKRIEGLYFAGQMNGSSGYEEAAAQGILAGINAGLFLSQQESFILTRADAYIGVLVDDLATKGTQEPYRMMTSRAEYRLLLRQDNADLRLTEKARRTGLISDKRYDLLMRKREGIQKLTEVLNSVVPSSQVLNEFLAQKGYSPVVTGVKLYNLLKRENIGYTDILGIFPDLPAYEPEISEQVEITAKYEGYIKKQQEQVMSFNELERIAIPENIDYMSIHGLKIEARQKFSQVKPKNLGQASRISGVSPADIAVLLVKIKSLR